jgi:hypothetical protein
MSNPSGRECATAPQAVVGKPTRAEVKALEGGFRQLMEAHAELFALVKRLGMGADEPMRCELDLSVDRLAQHGAEMTELCSSLRKLFQNEDVTPDSEVQSSDLAEAMATLDAINPGSPEWGPALLQVSDLFGAQLNEDEDEPFRSRPNRISARQPAEQG